MSEIKTIRIKSPRTWNINVYKAIANTAMSLLGPVHEWSKKVDLPKRDGTKGKAMVPVGPECMSDEDIQTVWELIHEVASAAAKREGLKPPRSEQACVMPFVICFFARNKASMGAKLAICNLPFAHVASSIGLITTDDFYALIDAIANKVN